MPSSLDAPKRTRTPRPKKNTTGRPDDITKLLVEFRFEKAWKDPQNLERELRSVQGTMIVYRTAATPAGTKEGAGVPNPVEFMIIDNDGKRIEHEIAETWGKAEEYGHVFARQRGLELVNNTLPFKPDSMA